MPYIQFHTNDWLNYTRDFSYITKGVLIDLLANTWNRECKWMKLDEVKEIALKRGLTLKQFDKVHKELWRKLTATGEFKFTFMEKQREDAIKKPKEKTKELFVFKTAEPYRKDCSRLVYWCNAFEPINKGKLGTTQGWRKEESFKKYY